MDTSKKPKTPPEELLEQINVFFPSYYMTLISVIQATSFGYLLYEFSKNFTLCNHLTLCNHVLYIMNLFVIIEVWYEYMMGSATLRWIPSILDSILPFFLGMAQFSIIFFSKAKGEDTAWYYWSFSFLCFISYFAFQNMYIGSDKLENKTNKLVLDNIGKYREFNLIAIYSLALVSAVFALIIQYQYHDVSLLLLACIMLILLSSFLIRGYFYWKSIVNILPRREML